MKQSFIIKSVEANKSVRLTFDTVLDFDSIVLKKLLQQCTKYKVLADDPNAEVISTDYYISLEAALYALPHLGIWYNEPVIKTKKILTPVISFIGGYIPFEISIANYNGLFYTFFKDIPYTPIRDYSISFKDLVSELFSEYEVKVSVKGDPFIKERLKITYKRGLVVVNKVTEESYIERVTKVAEY